MSKSVGNTMLVSEVVKRVRPVELRYYLVASHYRSVVEFSFEALEEAAAAYRRIEGFVRRADEALGGTGDATAGRLRRVRRGDGRRPVGARGAGRAAGRAARGQQAARRRPVAALRGHPAVRTRDARRARPRPAVADVVGRRRRRATDLHDVVGPAGRGRAGGARRGARSARTTPRPTGSATRLAAAGVAVEDTPAGPRWTLVDREPGAATTRKRTDGRQQRAPRGQAQPRVEEGAVGRVRRPAPQAAQGQGPDAQGVRAPEPPGAPPGEVCREARRVRRAGRPGGRRRHPLAQRRPGPARVRRDPSGSPAATPSSRRCAPGCRRPRCTSPSASTPTTGCASRSSSRAGPASR